MAKKKKKTSKRVHSARTTFSKKKGSQALTKLPSQIFDKVKKTKMRLIGIGGGGSSIVSEIASRVQKPTFVAANTDRQALKSISRKVLRFQFGEKFTGGLGTGMDPALAEEAAQNEKERIKKLFQGQDLSILIACLGGGVGSGAGPVFAKLAKNSGVTTLGVFTLPFKFEGERKMEIAKEALYRLRPHLNAIIILPNERIFQVIEGGGEAGRNIPLREAFSAVNQELSKSMEGLIETIYLPGLINIDFADLKTVLQGQGRLAFLNTAEVQAQKSGQEYIKKVISSSLYPYTVRGAKGILFNIAGEKEMSLSDVSQISKSISELVNPEAKIIFGVCQNKKYKEKIKVTLLATGCSAKVFSAKYQKKKRKKKKLKIDIPEGQKEKKKVLPEKRFKKASKRKKVKKLLKAPPKIKKRKKNKKAIVSRTLNIPGVPPVIAKIKKVPQLKSEKIIPSEEKTEIKIRKNGLQLKKEAEEAEKEMLEKEKQWETPAFLRLRFGRHSSSPPFNQSEENK